MGEEGSHANEVHGMGEPRVPEKGVGWWRGGGAAHLDPLVLVFGVVGMGETCTPMP